MGVRSQLSLAVGFAGVGAVHSTVVFAGIPDMVGAVRSVPVIVWVAFVLLPQSSVAVQVRYIS